MNKMIINKKEKQVVFVKGLENKLVEFNINENNIIELLNNNIEEIEDAECNEKIIILGSFTVVLTKTESEVKVENIISSSNIF